MNKLQRHVFQRDLKKKLKLQRREENLLKASFPLRNNGLIINSLEKINYRPFYDTKWRIEGSENDTDFTIVVTRFDFETFETMYRIISCAETTQQIRELDMRDKIYYD